MLLDSVWVVGGTSGIGAAVVERLEAQHEGLDVFTTGKDVDVQDAREIDLFAKESGPFDGIVYSAGINMLDWVEDLSTINMNMIYDVNVTGLVRVIRSCPETQRIVVVGSDAAHRPMRTSLAYCASKAALEMAVKVIAREHASDGFAINIVAPGMTDDTEMTRYIDARVPEVRDWSPEHARLYESSQIPMGRRAQPHEIAEVIVNTMFTNTSYLNGAVIEVNGGR